MRGPLDARAAALSLALATLVGSVAIVMAPWFTDTHTFGFHDWDAITSFRYLVKQSLLTYGELPFWNPYACGGYPSWGYVEGATNLVSPWLPAYLLLPIQLAIRVEAAGMCLAGALGAYAAASCFTKSHGARALVAALWAVNGRWGLQIAAGHAWHLSYAYLPWCLYFFEKARGAAAFRPTLGLATCLALMVYAGGIYPLPHTVLLLGGYALVSSVLERRAAPCATLARAGVIAMGLGAPKLLPMLDTFAGDPRLIASDERLSLGAFVTLLTHPEQPFGGRPAAVSPYGWHEWGMYVSWVGVAAGGYAILFVRGRREMALKLMGCLLLLLGFGAFHPSAPWTLLHAHLPIFSSQHVPSRFLYPAMFVLALVAASGIGRWVDRRARRRPWLDVLLAGAVALVAVDVARVAQQPMRAAMWMVPPPIAPGAFHFEREPPYHYLRRDWAGPVLLAMMGNVGVLDCYGVPRDRLHIAALPHDAPGYRGMLWLDGPGEVEMMRWSPNGVVARVSGASPGTRLVYNMNHRAGWQADGHEVIAVDGLVAVRLGDAPNGELRLRYRPPGWWPGLGLFALTAGGLVWWHRRREDP